MDDSPSYLSPENAEKMVRRAAAQLGEHFLGVAVIAVRQEDGGASGCYFRTAGNSHASEKAAEDFVSRAVTRRRVRHEIEARKEFRE